MAELESDPDLDFEWLPFPEYYDAPGRVPMGRSIQPVKIRRDELRPDVAALVRPPVELDRAGLPGRRTLTGGQALIARLATIVLREGGTVLTEHEVTALVRDGERVAGVRCADGRSRSGASRGVLLAAGGFEGDASKRAERGIPGDVAWSMAPRGANTGDPDRGRARRRRRGRLLRPRLVLPRPRPARRRRLVHPRLPLRPHGRRRPAAATATSRSPTTGSAGSWPRPPSASRPGTSSTPARAVASPPSPCPRATPPSTSPPAPGSPHRPSGTSPQPWASRPTRSTATVDRFNGFCEAGVDEDFGRGADEYDTFFAGGTGPNAALTGVDRPPYYAARFVLSDLGTKGGLLTDASGRVLREDGSTIPGLYASSNTTASMFGGVYPGPGAPLGSAMVLASLAVREMAGH